MTASCAQPHCDDYESVPGKCCDYTCPGEDDVTSEESRENDTPNDIVRDDAVAAQAAQAAVVLNGERVEFLHFHVNIRINYR